MNDRPSPVQLDGELFPPAFLKLLSVVPAAVGRLRASFAEGRRTAPGEGGRFLFRGHREYRPGDDLRRVDWRVAARLGEILVRQFDAERDLVTEVWLDGSASMGPLGGRVRSARVAALGVAVGLASAGQTRLGTLQAGAPRVLVEGRKHGHIPAFLEAISAETPQGRADLGPALQRLVRRIPRGARVLCVSDLLTRARPDVLQALAGRGLRGAVFHLRCPEVTAPRPVGVLPVEDVETGRRHTYLLDEAAARRVTERARAHADRWAREARAVGLAYVPFAPSTDDETLLRRVVEVLS